MLCLTSVTAINSGEDYLLKTIFCYDQAKVKVRGTNNIIFGEYSIQGCKEKPYNFWTCNCNDGHPINIILKTEPNTKNIYDIVLEYNILPADSRKGITMEGVTIHDTGIRTENFNNIAFNMKQKEIEKKKFEWPSITDNNIILIIIFITFIIIIILFGGYLAYKSFFGSADDLDNYIREKEGRTDKLTEKSELTDEELKNFLKNLNK